MPFIYKNQMQSRFINIAHYILGAGGVFMNGAD